MLSAWPASKSSSGISENQTQCERQKNDQDETVPYSFSCFHQSNLVEGHSPYDKDHRKEKAGKTKPFVNEQIGQPCTKFSARIFDLDLRTGKDLCPFKILVCFPIDQVGDK